MNQPQLESKSAISVLTYFYLCATCAEKFASSTSAATIFQNKMSSEVDALALHKPICTAEDCSDENGEPSRAVRSYFRTETWNI